MLNKLMRKLKTKTGMMYGIMLLTSLVLGLSYGTFIFVTDGYKATEMLVSNLMYGIEISSTGGTETINNTNVTISNGNTSTVLVKITSLNKINSKYGLDYKILSGTGNIYYASSTGWLPTGKINKNGSGIYEKTIKVVISATSDLTVDFNVSGGYTYNSEVASKSTYTRVSEVYDNILSYTTNKLLSEIVSDEANDGIYGGDATNNYLQYPESSNANENIWRIIGNYKSVSGIKLISNSKEIISVSDINTKLTNIYNTLDKTSEYVLSTNKFNCIGTTCTTSNYSNIGLLSSSEYNSDSYMNITDNWFTTNNNVVELVSGETISSTDTTTTGSLRASIYLQGDVSIKGSGTSTDPYRLVEKGDVIISSATLNGSTLSYFPTMSSPYLVNSVTCSNGTTGTWDNKKDKIVLDNINLPTVCNVDFKDGYTVNLTSTGGSIPSSVQVGRNGIATITLKPSDGYQLDGATTDCPNATISGSTLTIKNIKSNISCNVEFKEKIFTLTRAMLRDNPTISERTDFSVGYAETTTGTLYKTNKTEDGSDVYYYSGKTANNWVKFGKEKVNECVYNGEQVKYAIYDTSRDEIKEIRKVESSSECISTNICEIYYGPVVGLTEEQCSNIYNTTWKSNKATYNGTSEKDVYWRIIRTNEDGSVRLLYSGLDPTTSTGYIGMSRISNNINDPMYAGYMYGTSGSLENNRTNENDSVIKAFVDKWYEDTILDHYDKFVSKSAIYCNDRSVEDNDYSITSKIFAFGVDKRLHTNKAPSYKCGANASNGLFESTQAIADKFSASTSGGGNGQLKYPVALVTMDELIFAGGKVFTDLSPFPWYYANSSDNSITGLVSWYTISSEEWESTGLRTWIITIDVDNSVYTGSISSTLVYYENGVRPVISLDTCVGIKSGNGTPTNPYVVDENSCS